MKHINVLAQAITGNKIRSAGPGHPECRPCIAVFDTEAPRRLANAVEILGPSRVVFSLEGSPLSGAMVYIETDAEVVTS